MNQAIIEGSAGLAIVQGEANAVTHAANVAAVAITPAAENSLVAQTGAAIAGQLARAESSGTSAAATAAVVSQAVENATNQAIQDQQEEDERK